MVGIKGRRGGLLALVAGVALLLAACGGGNKSTPSGGSSSGGLTQLGQKLPSSIQQSKEIKVGSDIEYPPVEFFKEGTQEVQGFDFDLAQAMGQKLGVKVTFINDTDFAGILGALAAGRFDIVMSAMNDTPERRAKAVDFIDYFNVNTGILVAKGNPKGIKTLDDLCGQTVSVQKGTVQEDPILKDQQGKCTSAGKAKVNVLAFEKDADAVQQVKTGRAVAVLEDLPVSAYNAKTVGGGSAMEVAGTTTEAAGKYGIAVLKSNTQLRDALQEALKAVIADGSYDQLLQKWGIQAGALKTADINTGA
jgi:polar amino acid transport system substrate-binding protein